jgi:phenylalanine-4-hydroxylase
MLNAMPPFPSGYSPVVATGDRVRVELASDHPGYGDPVYRARRDAIAAVSAGWRPGQPVPAIDYTDVEHEVWRTACAELADKHRRYASAEFLSAAERLRLPHDRIPQLTEVTALLAPLTGFRYEPVAGLAPLRHFYRSFGDRTFFSTQYLRHPSQPLYTPEPDLVHEVVGHANQLASPVFARLYEEVGRAVERTRTEDALRFLSKVFWFTIEFGVVWEAGELRTYGAGILSSYGELDVFRAAEIRPLDFAEMGVRQYDITHYQPVLYAADSFPELVERLGEFFATFDDGVYRRLVEGRLSVS